MVSDSGRDGSDGSEPRLHDRGEVVMSTPYGARLPQAPSANGPYRGSVAHDHEQVRVDGQRARRPPPSHAALSAVELARRSRCELGHEQRWMRADGRGDKHGG